MKKKSKDGLLNREVGDGGGSSIKQDMSHDVGKSGYLRSDVGGVEPVNYRIQDGYRPKDESPSRSEGSSVQDIAHHSVTGEMYSGHPERHGHFGKVYKAGLSGSGGGSDAAKVGGGGHDEE
jgi:hypothetical protein